jgi:hypothetical protein
MSIAPTDSALACVNALGFAHGQSERYLQFLNRIGTAGLTTRPDTLEPTRLQSLIDATAGRIRPNMLAQFAYLLALDRYSDSSVLVYCKMLATQAAERSPDNGSIQLAQTLIEAQIRFRTDWCGVYRLWEGYASRIYTSSCVRFKALGIIEEYLMLYRPSCDSNR